MINFVKHRRLYFLFSGLIILAGIVAMVISTQTYKERSIIRLSIDFVSGTIFEARFSPIEGQTASPVSQADIEAIFAAAGLENVTAQQLGGTDGLKWQVRTGFAGNVSAGEGSIIVQLEKALTELAAKDNLTFDGEFFRNNFSAVSPIVGSEVTTAALIATFAASFLVLSWIAFAFRQLKHSLRFGMCAVLAMFHDVLVMVGMMSILGLLVGWEADALFITGLLTVVGYSVQDTIVIFDRIRENSNRRRGEPFELIVNRSILETVQRSMMTQIAVAFVLLSLFLVGGGSIHVFVGILFIGLLSGTYSSIFTAVPLLVAWEKGELPFVNRQAKAA
jgi:preprotein translocase SecF subunit